jgi:hypothetical protein
MVLAAKKYGVLDHLTEDAVPAKHDIEWCTIDLILKMWIYGPMIMDPAKMVL